MTDTLPLPVRWYPKAAADDQLLNLIDVHRVRLDRHEQKVDGSVGIRVREQERGNLGAGGKLVKGQLLLHEGLVRLLSQGVHGPAGRKQDIRAAVAMIKAADGRYSITGAAFGAVA